MRFELNQMVDQSDHTTGGKQTSDDGYGEWAFSHGFRLLNAISTEA